MLAAIALLLCSANALPHDARQSPFNISVGGSLDSDTLNRGQTLNAPATLVAGGGNVRLQVQGDGNLVIVEGQSDVLWASNTGPCVPAGQCHLFFWDDGANSGDVVLYGCPNCGKVLWDTNTKNTPASKLVMQSDCNLVLYDSSNKVLWASNTACKGPSPTPPSPPSPPGPSPPGPSPPGPSPGPLPPLPDKTWFGWWGGNTDAYGFTSLFIDSPQFEDDSHIDQYGGPSLRFLYPAYLFFCQEQQMSGKCTLFPDYQNRWNAAVPKLHQYLMDQKILGFNVGDERICGGDKHGTSIADWNTIISTMRNSFPRGQAIIYTNECHSTFESSGDTVESRRRRRKGGGSFSVPAGLDWIGFDTYYTDSGTHGFINNVVKPDYEQKVYPLLAAYQKVAITPQVTDCQKLHKNELGDANDAVAWAKSDPRVAFILPYRFDDLDTHCKGSDVYNFWANYGKSTK